MGSLLELYVRHKIPSSFYTLGQKHIASGSNGHYMGMFTKGFEGYWVVDLSVGLARIVESNEVRWLEGLLGDGVDIVMLSVSRSLVSQTNFHQSL